MIEGRHEKKDYKDLLQLLERELVAMARAKMTGQSICVLFDGCDTAGKRGAIKAISNGIKIRASCALSFCPKLAGRRLPHQPSIFEKLLVDDGTACSDIG